MHAHSGHLSAVRGDASVCVQCAKVCKEIAGARKCCCGRRVEPLQLGSIPRTPTCEFECERNEVGIENLGR